MVFRFFNQRLSSIRYMAALLACSGTSSLQADNLPPQAARFLQTYCLDCHSNDSAEAEISLEAAAIDWSGESNLQLWERVLNAVEAREMPPTDADQPKAAEREAMRKWLDEALTENSSIGGTPARRLNKDEYRASIESLFGIRNFKLPDGFRPCVSNPG